MKDNLLDIIGYTHSLGIIDLVKIVGTDTETEIHAIAEDKSVIVTGKTKTPVADFIGTFGMPNLTKLKTILGFDVYNDDSSTIDMTKANKDGNEVPSAIHFATKQGDFVNDYRLMSQAIIEEKVKPVSPDTSVEDLATKMIDEGKHYFPVLDGNKLVGVVTKKDIVKAIAKGKL